MTYKLPILYFVSILITGISGQFNCYSCQGGPASHCGDATLPIGLFESCQGPNAQCYFAIKWFQKGVIRLIERRCWIPKANSTITDYCKSFNNTDVGELKYCRTCKTDLCNNDHLTCGNVANPKTTNYGFAIPERGIYAQFCSK